eukprot:6203026-Pleurochrysis_carterae.AAC.1
MGKETSCVSEWQRDQRERARERERKTGGKKQEKETEERREKGEESQNKIEREREREGEGEGEGERKERVKEISKEGEDPDIPDWFGSCMQITAQNIADVLQKAGVMREHTPGCPLL